MALTNLVCQWSSKKARPFQPETTDKLLFVSATRRGGRCHVGGRHTASARAQPSGVCLLH